MKHIKLLRYAMLGCGLMIAFGSQAYPPKLDGRMQIFDYHREEALELPDSLHAERVAYVARHGARYMTGIKKFALLKEKLNAYHSQLTPKGLAMLALIDSTQAASEGKWGDLSSVGESEQVHFASGLDTLVPRLAEKGRVVAVSTYVPRVIATMDAFTYTLSARNPDLELQASAGKRYDELLRFFDTDGEYKDYLKHGDWKAVYDDFESRVVPVAPVEALFEGNALSELDHTTLQKMSMEMYSVFSSQQAMGLENPVEEFMTQDEYAACWKVSNVEQYLTRAINSYTTLPAKAAAPLLKAVISGLAGEREGCGEMADADMRLYFGHAETLIPLLSLMNLPGTNAMPLDLSDLADTWRNYNLAPLGGNLLIILASTTDGREYAAVRLNGRNVSPLHDDRLWTPWDEVRAYWKERMVNL